MKPFLLPALIILNLALAAPAENWPRFRGPNGSGVAADAIPVRWTAENVKWRTKLPGVGHGSPVVWNGRVFVLCGNQATAERLPTCVDARSGKVLWSQVAAASAHRTHKYNSFASTTPAVDSEQVYFSWGTPERLTLAAFTHDGAKVWETNHKPVKGGHGFAASPMLHGDLVLINNDQDGESSLLALDRATGRVRWEIPRRSERLSYSTPCVYRNAKGEDEIIFTNWEHGITGVNPATGSVLWENDVFGKPSQERAIGSPVLAGELVIGTCGFVTKLKHVVALQPVPGRKEAREIWRIEKSAPHIPTPLVVGGFIFLWNDAGVVTCANSQTGEILWNERVSGECFGSPVAAGGNVFCAAKDGKVSVIPASGKFAVLATNELKETCYSTPAVSDGRMFIRTYQHLVAIGE